MTGPRPRAEALLIDFDGVLRHHDPAPQRGDRDALRPGAGDASSPRGWSGPGSQPAITGADRPGPSGWTASPRPWPTGSTALTARRRSSANSTWTGASSSRWCSRSSGRSGRPGSRSRLASNATAELADDSRPFGIAGDFDAVVNSSAIGVHKPTAGFFRIACAGRRGAAAALPLRRRHRPQHARGPSGRAVGLSLRAAGRPSLRPRGPRAVEQPTRERP